MKMFFFLPQQDCPKSILTSCTMYGSRRLTYHHGDLATSVREQVEASKKVEVDPSTAFWGIPFSTTEDCIGALPAATFKTGEERENKRIYNKTFDCYTARSGILYLLATTS